jgi:hypothetical protein
MRATVHVAKVLLAGLVLALLCWTYPAPAPVPADTNTPASQPDLGQINGTIEPAQRVRSIRCLDRAGRLSFAAHWHGENGRFDVANLALGLRYDLEVTMADGVTFIGVDLSSEEDRLARLARQRKEADENGESPTSAPADLTDEDRASIERIVTQIDMFENERKILALAGTENHSRATALVELRRTTPFHSGKGDEQIRRVELWYFKYQHGGWEKVANAEKVLSRTRAAAGQIEKQSVSQVYLPALGGILVDKAKPVATLTVTLPGSPGTQPAAGGRSQPK